MFTKHAISTCKETLLKTEFYWKCYSYGDELIPIFDYIDELRTKIVREVFSSNQEQTEELIEKHDKNIHQLENKRKIVIEFISTGEKMMKEPFCPKFLKGHVKKLQDAWDDSCTLAEKRKISLLENMHAWITFEEKKIMLIQQLDILKVNHNSIKKIFDIEQGSMEYNMKLKRQTEGRNIAVNHHKDILAAVDSIKLYLPNNKTKDIEDQVNELETRMAIMAETDKKLAYNDDFNKRLIVFSQGLKDVHLWVDDGYRRLQALKKDEDNGEPSPEVKITKVMELLEDLSKKSNIAEKLELEKNVIFPKPGEKASSDAKAFITMLKEVSSSLRKLSEETNILCTKYADDVKFWAQFQTGLAIFSPWLQKNEDKIKKGLARPAGLVEACEILEECKLCLTETVKKLMILEAASEAAHKMTSCQNADIMIDCFKNRWEKIHECYLEWTAR